MEPGSESTLWRMVTLAGVHLLAVLSPGPDIALVLRNSFAAGRLGAGVSTAVGIGLGNGVHILLSLLGLGVVVASAPVVLTLMKWAAAGYLIWLGTRIIATAPGASAGLPGGGGENGGDGGSPMIRDSGKRKWLVMGFVTSTLNPKALLFYFSMFTVLLDPSKMPRTAAVVMALYLPVATAAVFSTVSWIANLGVFRSVYGRHGHWFDRAMGVVLILVAVALAWGELGG